MSAEHLKWRNVILAFLAGCVVPSASSWLITDVGAQGGREDGIHVCVDESRVLRLAQTLQCPQGQQSLYFKKPDASIDAPKPENTPTPTKNPSIDKQKLAELERRLQEMETAARSGELGNRAVAPFEVVDRAGKRIFSVEKSPEANVAQLFNTAGNPVAVLVARPVGGQLSTRSWTSTLAAYIGIFGEGKTAGMRVLDSGKTRIDVGKDEEKGGYRLKIFGGGGKAVAAIGQNSVGSGTAQVADEAGVVRAILSTDESKKGVVNIYNALGHAVAALTEGASAGGLLQISNSGGQVMVEAGVAAEGFGVVRAGPAGFKPGLGFFGVPGSYIAGKP